MYLFLSLVAVKKYVCCVKKRVWMEFTNLIFLFCVLPSFLGICYFVPGKLQDIAVLLLSFFCISWGAPILFFKMLCCSILNYIFSYFICRARGKFIDVFLFVFCLIVNLCIFYKLLFSFNSEDLYFFKANILNFLPVSLFFMNIFSYLADVFSERVYFQYNIVCYLLYIFMFPKFFLGPIVPYNKFVNRLNHKNKNGRFAHLGVQLFIFGFCKVSILSHEIGQVVKFFVNKAAFNLPILSSWVGAFAMFLYIYFYFSGYGDMARGLSFVMGYSLPANFGRNMFCGSLTEFFTKFFNVSVIDYFKFYVLPSVGDSSKLLKFFKYLAISFLYYWFLGGSVFAFSVFMLVFIENFILKYWINKVKYSFRRFFYFLVILYLATVFFLENSVLFYKSDVGYKYLAFMFGKNATFLDMSLIFLVVLFRCFIVVFCFFVGNFYFKWLNKLNIENNIKILILKYISLTVLFVFSLTFCF